jgi:hypothetical protein
MSWQFWRQSGPSELSVPVSKALQSQLQVDAQGAGRLRSISKAGRFARRRVQLIRIFDPALVVRPQQGPLKYLDLVTHPGALLYDGHIESDGSVFLARAA